MIIIVKQVRPHAFWFVSLQSLVSCCLTLINGVFGGTHAGGLTRSLFAHMLTAVSSIALLMSFGAIARSVNPFRNRARDSWKLHALLFSVCVAAYSKLLAFVLALRPVEFSAAYDETVTYLAIVVVIACVALCAAIILAFLFALGVHLLAFALLKKLGCTTAAVKALIAKLRRSLAPPLKDPDAGGNNAIELAPIEGGDAHRDAGLHAVDQLNPLRHDIGNIDALLGDDDDPFAARDAEGFTFTAPNSRSGGGGSDRSQRAAVIDSLFEDDATGAGGAAAAVDRLAMTANPLGSGGGADNMDSVDEDDAAPVLGEDRLATTPNPLAAAAAAAAGGGGNSVDYQYTEFDYIVCSRTGWRIPTTSM